MKYKTKEAIDWLIDGLQFCRPEQEEYFLAEWKQTAIAEYALIFRLIQEHEIVSSERQNELTKLISLYYLRPSQLSKLPEVPRSLIGYLVVDQFIPTRGKDQRIEKSLLVKKLRFLYLIEKLPYRELEFLYLVQNTDYFPFERNSFQRIFPSTILGKVLKNDDWSILSSSDIYTITHEIFYLTSFGKTSPRFLKEKEETIEELLLFFAKRLYKIGHVDLFSEVVLCLIYIGCFNDTWMKSIEGVLSTFQQEGGRVWNGLTKVNGSGVSEKIELFKNSYHSTLISLLLVLTVSKENEKDK